MKMQLACNGVLALACHCVQEVGNWQSFDVVQATQSYINLFPGLLGKGPGGESSTPPFTRTAVVLSSQLGWIFLGRCLELPDLLRVGLTCLLLVKGLGMRTVKLVGVIFCSSPGGCRVKQKHNSTCRMVMSTEHQQQQLYSRGSVATIGRCSSCSGGKGKCCGCAVVWPLLRSCCVGFDKANVVLLKLPAHWKDAKHCHSATVVCTC